MDRDDGLVLHESEGISDWGIKDLGNSLDFKVMVAGAERAHLATLPLLGAFGDHFWPGARHGSSFLDPLEIAPFSRATFDCPACTPSKHQIHLD